MIEAGSWIDLLRADPRDWLLDEENPSVRYFGLRDILDLPENDTEVGKAKRRFMEEGDVPRILAEQKAGGFWETEADFYVRTKYRGTVWQLIILAEMGADGSDPRIKKACQFILDWSQDRESGGFSFQGSRSGGGYHSGVIPCLTGNMVWSLIRFGWGGDPRVEAGIRWVAEFQRTDDGETEPPAAWPYTRFESCWGRHTCTPGLVKALKAVSEIPVDKRTPEVEGLISRGTEFLLMHRLFKRSHDLDRVAKPKWTRFGFPTMWGTDALEMARILLRLGISDGRMQEAVGLIVSKQDDQGRWPLEHTDNGRFRFNIERKGRPSRWVTLHALQALKGYRGGPRPCPSHGTEIPGARQAVHPGRRVSQCGRGRNRD